MPRYAGVVAHAPRTRSAIRARKRQPTREDPSECHSHAVGPVARDGCSNSEIGAEPFLSPRTVEWHLRKVFTKLGISSRRELQGALPDRTGLARPA